MRIWRELKKCGVVKRKSPKNEYKKIHWPVTCSWHIHHIHPILSFYFFIFGQYGSKGPTKLDEHADSFIWSFKMTTWEPYFFIFDQYGSKGSIDLEASLVISFHDIRDSLIRPRVQRNYFLKKKWLASIDSMKDLVWFVHDLVFV